MSEQNGNGRDRSGKFTRGNAGGPGGPRRAAEESYVHLLASRCTGEHWAKIVDKAIQQAEAGDRHARAWLSECLIGDQPLATHELVEAYRALEAKLEEQNELKRQLLAQGQNAPAGRPPWLGPNGEDPLDKHCVFGPDDVPYDVWRARQNGQATLPAPDPGDTLIDAPPPHRHPGDDDVARILEGGPWR
jgi:hypothetical protein